MKNDLNEIRSIIFKYYVKWIEKSGKPKSISDLSEETGITRQTLYALLGNDVLKKPKIKTIVALASVWGDSLYTDLDIDKPQISGKNIWKEWNNIPDEVRDQIISIAKPYLTDFQ